MKKKSETFKGNSEVTFVKKRKAMDVHVHLTGDGADAFCRMERITKRYRDNLACDIFKSFLWILHQQTFGAEIKSTKSPDYEDKMVNLVKDRAAAQKYFDDLGW